MMSSNSFQLNHLGSIPFHILNYIKKVFDWKLLHFLYVCKTHHKPLSDKTFPYVMLIISGLLLCVITFNILEVCFISPEVPITHLSLHNIYIWNPSSSLCRYDYNQVRFAHEYISKPLTFRPYIHNLFGYSNLILYRRMTYSLLSMQVFKWETDVVYCWCTNINKG